MSPLRLDQGGEGADGALDLNIKAQGAQCNDGADWRARDARSWNDARRAASTRGAACRLAGRDQARKMHDGEMPTRAIRGEATLAQAKELWDEGVPVMPVPVLPEDRN
jgi:hypothetical protein